MRAHSWRRFVFAGYHQLTSRSRLNPISRSCVSWARKNGFLFWNRQLIRYPIFWDDCIVFVRNLPNWPRTTKLRLPEIGICPAGPMLLSTQIRLAYRLLIPKRDSLECTGMFFAPSKKKKEMLIWERKRRIKAKQIDSYSHISTRFAFIQKLVSLES